MLKIILVLLFLTIASANTVDYCQFLNSTTCAGSYVCSVISLDVCFPELNESYVLSQPNTNQLVYRLYNSTRCAGPTAQTQSFNFGQCNIFHNASLTLKPSDRSMVYVYSYLNDTTCSSQPLAVSSPINFCVTSDQISELYTTTSTNVTINLYLSQACSGTPVDSNVYSLNTCIAIQSNSVYFSLTPMDGGQLVATLHRRYNSLKHFLSRKF